MLLVCSTQVASSLVYLLLIRPRREGAGFNFIEWAVSLAVVAFYLNSYEERKRSSFVSSSRVINEERSLKDYELNLGILLENSEEDKDQENVLVGVIKDSVQRCEDPNCWARQSLAYDPLLKQNFSPKFITKAKDSAYRLFLRCTYNRAISHRKTKQKMLDFVEFSISELGDFSKHCFIIADLETEALGFIDKVRFYKLKLLLKEGSDTFNRFLYGGKIEINEVIAAEQTYDSILEDIEEYCARSVRIWNHTMQREANISELKEKMNDNFELVSRINEKWNGLLKFLGVQLRWKFTYLTFALFLKNEKVKARDLSFLEELVESKTTTGNSEIDPLLA